MDSTTLLQRLQLPHAPLVVDLQDLVAQLATLVDPRARRGLRYRLDHLLTLALLAKLSGANHLRAIARWVARRAAPLVAFLALPRPTMPCYSTFARVFGALDVAAFDALLGRFFAARPSLGPPAPGEWVLSIDGKTLRGTIARGQTSGVHLVAAYLPGAGVVLAQLDVAGKANELTVAPKLLAQLDLAGLVVTGDALFAQRTLSLQIVQGGGDYLWTVKGNQASLRDDIAWLFAPLREGERAADFDWRSAHTVAKAHGRLEEYDIVVSRALQGYSDWPGLAQVFQVTCRRTEGGRTTESVRYGVTSLSVRQADPARLLAVLKGHWGIEGGLHQRRDVSLQEDHDHVRTGHAPHVLASLNNAVIALLVGRGGQTNLAEAREDFGYAWDLSMHRYGFQSGTLT